MPLDRKQILAKRELPRETVAVPEWGGEVIVRALTGAERDDFEQEYLAAKQGAKYIPNLRARLLVRALCDEAGKPLLTPADIEALGAQSAAALQRCYNVASRLNGLSKSDQEELEKN